MIGTLQRVANLLLLLFDGRFPFGLDISWKSREKSIIQRVKKICIKDCNCACYYAYSICVPFIGPFLNFLVCFLTVFSMDGNIHAVADFDIIIDLLLLVLFAQ